VAVEIRLPTVLRQYANGVATVKADGETIGQLLEDLERQFPAMKGQIIGDDGKLHKFVNVYLNDDDIRYLQNLDTKVAPGDKVAILPAVAGGA
jgi:molybdopterin synthase sulfur carrier subunit